MTTIWSVDYVIMKCRKNDLTQGKANILILQGYEPFSICPDIHKSGYIVWFRKKETQTKGEASKMKSLEEREQRERERREIINNAVQAADRIILDGSDGSVEETNWLTSEVAKGFVEKVNIALTSSLLRKDLVD